MALRYSSDNSTWSSFQSAPPEIPIAMYKFRHEANSRLRMGIAAAEALGSTHRSVIFI